MHTKYKLFATHEGKTCKDPCQVTRSSGFALDSPTSKDKMQMSNLMDLTAHIGMV